MTEKLKQPVCVKQCAANAELHVSKGHSLCTTTERTGMLRDNVFKDLVHARTSVEANCLFLLVDCLPTSWSVLSSLITKTCADGELFIWRRHTGNAEPAGWIFRNIFWELELMLCFFLYLLDVFLCHFLCGDYVVWSSSGVKICVDLSST